MLYVLNAREDQLASVFLSNIAEIVMCMNMKWIPLLPIKQNYDNSDRSQGEKKDHPLFVALRQLFQRANYTTPADFLGARTIPIAAVGRS
jgi:hypothetical protein